MRALLRRFVAWLFGPTMYRAECDCDFVGEWQCVALAAFYDAWLHRSQTGHVDQTAFLAGLSGFTEGAEDG